MERHDAFEVFVELYPAIIQSLVDIAEGGNTVTWSRDTVNNASGLLVAIEKFSFLVTLVVVQNVIGYIKGRTKLLQERSLDIVQGIALVEDVQKQLYEIREDVDEWHSVWYSMAKNRAEEEGTEEPGIYPDYVDDRSTETAAAQKPIWKHLKYTIGEF